MKVLFAPDWRQGVPYQRLLAEALAAREVNVSFLSHYKRLLPLARMVHATHCDIFHLHWPEAYYPQMRDRLDMLRRARFSVDLLLGTWHMPYVLTAHNLCEHNQHHLAFARLNYATAYRRANLVFAHSAASRARLEEVYGVDPAKVRIVPHGDLSVAMPPPVPRAEARAQLSLPDGPICLMFGAVEPYKGQEEVLAYWNEARPGVHLLIVGKPKSSEYCETIRRAADGVANVTLRLQWLSDPELGTYLSAADCALFNYRTIFTSGAASLARSRGLPILLPTRLDTVDLAEPDPRVIRFEALDNRFPDKLAAALSIASDFNSAEKWREQISWARVADLTVAGYREVLGAVASSTPEAGRRARVVF
jgi:glycosyltransferase involved in cell wall biosynthesis